MVWSFFLKSLGVLVLRFQRTDQEYKTPLNFRIRRGGIAGGPVPDHAVLFLVALANLFSKQIATIYGVAFTRRAFHPLYRFRADQRAQAPVAAGGTRRIQSRPQAGNHRRCRPRPAGCVLVAVRDYRRMAHLKAVLQKTNVRQQDIVVMTVRPVSAERASTNWAKTSSLPITRQELFTPRGLDGGKRG